MNMKKMLLSLMTLLAGFTASAQSFEGTWKGSLTVQETVLPLVFEFRYDGAWKGTMQSPQQTSNKFRLSALEVAGDSLALQLENMGIRYSGKLASDRSAIEGRFTQGTVETELTLVRADETAGESALVFRRSQRVIPPYPYDTLDVTFTNPIGHHVLAGTMTRPRQAGRFAAVALISGSGPHDRDGAMMGHQPLKVLADFLTRNNIIVLRYDDRGVGDSEGDFAHATTGDFGQDALAALNFLKQQPKVDPTRVGIVGHSEGGLIATILAGQHASGLHFIASLAGPTIPMDSLLLLQNEAVMAAEGMTLSDADRELIKRNYAIAASDVPAREAFDQILENMKSIQGSQEAEGVGQISTMVTPWFRHFIRIDPGPFIRDIQIPVFAAFGGKDVQVPAEPNKQALEAHLAAEVDNRIAVYPELNHLFQHANSGSVSEYRAIEETMDPALLTDLAAWINAR